MRKRGWFPVVGDFVRIRQWKDMEDEFGTDSHSGDISCKFIFTKEMKSLCGKEFEITHITSSGRIDGHGFSYSISADMIEPVPDEYFDSSELDVFFSGIPIR